MIRNAPFGWSCLYYSAEHYKIKGSEKDKREDFGWE